MYKLKIISGPDSGKIFFIKEMVTSIGRQSENIIVLNSSRVSKNHCVIDFDENKNITVRDVGSSNGTFVNGILIKSKKLKANDRISIGEYVFEFFGSLNENIEKNNAPFANETQSNLINSKPDFKAKLINFFENRVMVFFYNLNIKNEWKIICTLIFGFFLLCNLFITVRPLLNSNRATLIKEVGKRALFMAREIAEKNTPFLAAQAETKTDLGIVENAEGVRLALLIDLENRIIAPGNKLNQYLNSGGEALIAIKARDLFRSGKETGWWVEQDETTVVGIEPVKILNSSLGKNVVVAIAIVSIDTTLSTPDLGEIGVVYSETFIMTSILGLLVLLILYKLTLNPIQVLNEKMDKELSGSLSEIPKDYKFEELTPLWDLINSALQRIPKKSLKSESASSGFLDLNSSLIEAEDYSLLLNPLKGLGDFEKIGVVLFDSEKKINFLNSFFEEISGIRSMTALGQDISSVARDEAMVIFIKDIMSKVLVGQVGLFEDFEISGLTYKVYLAAFGAINGIAKCYLLTMIKVEN